MLATQRLLIPDVAIKDPRRGRRFSLVLPCRITSPHTKYIRLAGTTCNMSRTGVLVRFYHLGASVVLPQVGESAPLEIDLPTSPSFSPRFLHCMAVVVRVLEVETDHLAVAFELRRVRVEERHKEATSDTGAIFQMPTGPGRVQ
jgi:hypothetical protein